MLLLHCSLAQQPAIATSRAATPRIELLPTVSDDDADAAGSGGHWKPVYSGTKWRLGPIGSEHGWEWHWGKERMGKQAMPARDEKKKKAKGEWMGRRRAGKHQDRIHKAITEGRKWLKAVANSSSRTTDWRHFFGWRNVSLFLLFSSLSSDCVLSSLLVKLFFSLFKLKAKLCGSTRSRPNWWSIGSHARRIQSPEWLQLGANCKWQIGDYCFRVYKKETTILTCRIAVARWHWRSKWRWKRALYWWSWKCCWFSVTAKWRYRQRMPWEKSGVRCGQGQLAFSSWVERKSKAHLKKTSFEININVLLI